MKIGVKRTVNTSDFFTLKPNSDAILALRVYEI